MTTNTYEQLEKLYDRFAPGTLQEDLSIYLQYGYLFATPKYIIMFQHVNDGWYIHAAVGVGCLKEFIRLMPYYLPYVGWERERGKGMRWYNTDKVTRIVYGKERQKVGTAGCSSNSGI